MGGSGGDGGDAGLLWWTGLPNVTMCWKLISVCVPLSTQSVVTIVPPAAPGTAAFLLGPHLMFLRQRSACRLCSWESPARSLLFTWTNTHMVRRSPLWVKELMLSIWLWYFEMKALENLLLHNCPKITFFFTAEKTWLSNYCPHLHISNKFSMISWFF